MNNPLPAHPRLVVDSRDPAPSSAPGTRRPWADPAHVRAHVRKLLEASTYQAVAAAANLGQMTVWEIANHARPVIKAETATALLAVAPGGIQPPRVDANGCMWRLRALVAMGHTTGRIATALGVSSHIVGPLIKGDRATVAAALRGDITRLFGAWWDKRPPSPTAAKRTAACKARQRAAKNNWPCPAALDGDELDVPGYKPTARWRYAQGTGIADDDPLGKNHQETPRPEYGGRQAEPLAQIEREAG